MRILRPTAVTLYALTAGILLVMSLAIPAVRANRWLSYAPLREAILPPPRPIVLSLLDSTEKEAWPKSVLEQMKADGVSLDGRPFEVTIDKVGPRELIPTAEPAQRLALVEHGSRPVTASVSFDTPGTRLTGWR